MKILSLAVITGSIIATGASMFHSLASNNGFYKETNGKEKYIWVNVREEDAVYKGNYKFETTDGNIWCVTDSEYDIDGQYVLVMNDNGTENYVYDDEVMEVYEK